MRQKIINKIKAAFLVTGYTKKPKSAIAEDLADSILLLISTSLPTRAQLGDNQNLLSYFKEARDKEKKKFFDSRNFFFDYDHTAVRKRCYDAGADWAFNFLSPIIEKLQQETQNLKTVMIAAAEEIQAHWDAHCDSEGYGPSNLMHRLEKGIPAEYGYTPGAFEKLKEANKYLNNNLEKLREENNLLKQSK